jgi:hypothetical protein
MEFSQPLIPIRFKALIGTAEAIRSQELRRHSDFAASICGGSLLFEDLQSLFGLPFLVGGFTG